MINTRRGKRLPSVESKRLHKSTDVLSVGSGGASPVSNNVGTSSSKPISVVLVDNHHLMLGGLVSLFEHEPDIVLTGQTTSGNTALDLISRLRPDVALLDIHVPPKGALEIVKELRQAEHATKCVILAGRMTDGEFMQAMRLSVRGIFLKAMPSSLLVRCVRIVHAGEEFIEKEMFLRAFGKLLLQSGVQQKLRETLTSRELTAVDLAVAGMNNKEIARKLAITEGTVKTHLHRAYAKLGVNGRIGLAQYARENGMV